MIDNLRSIIQTSYWWSNFHSGPCYSHFLAGERREERVTGWYRILRIWHVLHRFPRKRHRPQCDCSGFKSWRKDRERKGSTSIVTFFLEEESEYNAPVRKIDDILSHHTCQVNMGKKSIISWEFAATPLGISRSPRCNNWYVLVTRGVALPVLDMGKWLNRLPYHFSTSSTSLRIKNMDRPVLAEFSLDLQIYICEFLHPFQILALRKVGNSTILLQRCSHRQHYRPAELFMKPLPDGSFGFML